MRQRGQGMTEYILLVALIAIAVIVGVKIFGTTTNAAFTEAAVKVAVATK